MRSTQLILQLVVASLFTTFQWTQAQIETPQSQPQKRNEFIVVDGLPIVTIDAQVVSKRTGLVVNGLTHRDFTISENGIEQVIAVWEQQNAPLSVQILVDPVDLNGNHDLIENQLKALRASVPTLESKDEVSLIIIAERPVVLQTFTGDKELISAAIDTASSYKTSLPRQSDKRFLATLTEAVKSTGIQRNAGARKATILLSHMAQTAARRILLPEELVRQVVASSSAYCSTSLWVRDRNLSEREVLAFDKITLADLVHLTGGEILGNEWKGFLERLRERHRKGYVPLGLGNERTRDLVRIKVELAPKRGRNRSDFKLNYPSAVALPAPN